MRVKRSNLKSFIRREFRKQEMVEGLRSWLGLDDDDDDDGGRDRPSREGGYPPGVEEDVGEDVDRFYSRYSDEMTTSEMSLSAAVEEFEEATSRMGTDEGVAFSAVYWAGGASAMDDASDGYSEGDTAIEVIESEFSGREKSAMMWVAEEDKAQELFDISSGEWIFPEEEEPEEEEEDEEEESGRDKRKLDRQSRRQGRQEKRKGRREERQEKRAGRREDRQERRAGRQEDRQERREERSEMSGRERRQSRRDDRRDRRRSRRNEPDEEEDDT